MTWLELLEYISKKISYGCKAGCFDSMHVHDWNKVIVITNYRIPKILQNVNWRIHVSLFLLANLRFLSTVFNTQICDFHRSWNVVTDQLLWLVITFAGMCRIGQGFWHRFWQILLVNGSLAQNQCSINVLPSKVALGIRKLWPPPPTPLRRWWPLKIKQFAFFC